MRFDPAGHAGLLNRITVASGETTYIIFVLPVFLDCPLAIQSIYSNKGTFKI